MYALHPFTVHFPIGLLLASVLFTTLFLRRGGTAWETSAFHCLLFGWFGSVAAVLSGLVDVLQQLTGPDASRDPALLGWVNAHAAAGIVAMLIFGRALLLRWRNPALLSDSQARGDYLSLLGFGAVLLLLAGWLGGHLVYTLRMGTG